MGKKPRVVEAGMALHVWQRGNHQETVFANDAEHRMFLSILYSMGQLEGMKIHAYCLMTNHYHLIVEGEEKASISRAVGRVNQEYSTFKHRRAAKRGQLWQGRFGSKPLYPAHFWAALCYVERNPVAAGMVSQSWDWEWSSARAHLGMVSDPFLALGRWKERYDAVTWRGALETGVFASALEERNRAGKILVSRDPGKVLGEAGDAEAVFEDELLVFGELAAFTG
jgi:putative transposase